MNKPSREPVIRPIRHGVLARYLEGDKLVSSKTTPTALAETLHIRPAKFVLRHCPWDHVTYGTEGYRTTVHAFKANGFEVDIGNGWGQYKNEEIKPYAKFDVRKALNK